MKNKACRTLVRIDENGAPIYKDKVKYKTFEKALKNANKINAKPTSIMKCEAYKCGFCGRFHVGRTKKLLTHKVNIFKNPSV